MSVIRTLAFALLFGLTAPLASAQQVIENDPDLTAQLARAMGVSSSDASSIYFAGNGEGLAFLYSVIEGAAGNFDITVGYFRQGGDGLRLGGIVRDLYGTSPRDARFDGDAIRVTTTMPRPGEPRCCPTGVAIWSIDRDTLAVSRLQ